MKAAGLVVCLLCCACSSPSDGRADQLAAATNPRERDPFTRTWEVEIDGKPVGYLVEYLPIPAGNPVERALPAGSYRIQGPHFEDLGYITPEGDVRRFTSSTSSLSLGKWPRDDGLLRFFGGNRRVGLKPLALPKPAPVEPAKPPTGEPPAEGKKDDAKKE